MGHCVGDGGRQRANKRVLRCPSAQTKPFAQVAAIVADATEFARTFSNFGLRQVPDMEDAVGRDFKDGQADAAARQFAYLYTACDSARRQVITCLVVSATCDRLGMESVKVLVNENNPRGMP